MVHIVSKAGIIFGMIAVGIALVIWIPVTIAENEQLFMRVFFDKNIHVDKMKETESYKAMIERYPDAIVDINPHHMRSRIEVSEYGTVNENVLYLYLHYEPSYDISSEQARCRVAEKEMHNRLGTTPPEIIDDPPIPKVLFMRGEADEGFTADFIRYTDCLDHKISPEPDSLRADHYVSIPENTDVPGCEEDNACFIPHLMIVKVGQVVAFGNFDSESHTVTSGRVETGPNGLFDSHLIEPGDKFSHKFTKAGEYDYFCLVHPWQSGVIVVHPKA